MLHCIMSEVERDQMSQRQFVGFQTVRLTIHIIAPTRSYNIYELTGARLGAGAYDSVEEA